MCGRACARPCCEPTLRQTLTFNQHESRNIEHPATATPAILHIEGLRFGYPQRELFTHLSARIASGVTLVCGGDGSGKTTLLRLLAGQLPAQAGVLQVNDMQLSDRPQCYRQQVFWADPQSETWDQLCAVDYFKSLPLVYPEFDEQMLAGLIKGLSLTPHLHKPLYMLSTGSKRKVWLAAAFASRATVTLLDEPFAALDKASIGFVLELLADASSHPGRAWLVAHYEAPGDVPLTAIIDLDNL